MRYCLTLLLTLLSIQTTCAYDDYNAPFTLKRIYGATPSATDEQMSTPPRKQAFMSKLTATQTISALKEQDVEWNGGVFSSKITQFSVHAIPADIAAYFEKPYSEQSFGMHAPIQWQVVKCEVTPSNDNYSFDFIVTNQYGDSYKTEFILTPKK